MLFRNVAIEAVAYELPPYRVTTESLEDQLAELMQRLCVPRGSLERLTGIRERQFWDYGALPSNAATLAARKALEKAEVTSDQIGCLVNTSVSRDYVEPATASIVHNNLKLSPRCINYDIGNACLGFLNGIYSVGMMIEAGLIKYGLVVNGEGAQDVVAATIRRLQSPQATKQDFHANIATLTLGSVAVAMVLSHRSVSRSNHIINGAVTMAATEHNQLCVGQHDWMKTDASALQKAGLKLAAATWRAATETLASWEDKAIALYVPHQVSAPYTAAVVKTIALTPSKLQLNFPTFGNTGPAGLPLALAQAEELGRIKAGDLVGLLGIGSGLNCSVISVTW